MTRLTLFGMVVTCLALGTATATWAYDMPDAGPLRLVVHVNVSESGTQGAGLKDVANILKEAPDTMVEVVCHGAGNGLMEKARTDQVEAVEALIKKGVKFVACENTMRQKSIKKDDLLQGVGTVPSGAVEVVRKRQKDGYAYFKP